MPRLTIEELAVIALILDAEEEEALTYFTHANNIGKHMRVHDSLPNLENACESPSNPTEMRKSIHDFPPNYKIIKRTYISPAKRKLRARMGKPRTKLAKTRKRVWVHDSLKKRRDEGEFVSMLKEVTDDETKFYHYFRMSQGAFNFLLGSIKNQIQKKDTFFRVAISAKERLTFCLRYLITGESVKIMAEKYRIGQATAQQIVVNTCRVIIKTLKPQVMPHPNEQKWAAMAGEFWIKCKFPNCLGALSAKHVVIQSSNAASAKASHGKVPSSVLLLALVDARLNFITVEVIPYGEIGEGEVFTSSDLRAALESGSMNIPPEAPLPDSSADAPYVFATCNSFPLKKYLMTPCNGKQLKKVDAKQIFNKHLGRVRTLGEKAFGILTQKFGIYGTRIIGQPEKIDLVIVATCVLHNFIQVHDAESNCNVETDELPPATVLQNIAQQNEPSAQDGFTVQETLKQFLKSRPNM